MSLLPRVACVATLGLAAAGCGGRSDALPREPVSGRVTLDGQPLEAGSITFLPTGGSGPAAGGTIAAGAYALARAEGPTPGLHRVEIQAERATGKTMPDPDSPGQTIEETRNIVPARYNLDSTLTAEVAAGGKNAFDFELSSQAPPASRTKRDRRTSR